jgi:hypothetical protein
MPSAEAVVLAFGAQHKSVQAARLTDGLKTFATAGENFVDVGLVAHVERDLVFGGMKDRMQSQGQFDHAQVRSQVAAGL